VIIKDVDFRLPDVARSFGPDGWTLGYNLGLSPFFDYSQGVHLAPTRTVAVGERIGLGGLNLSYGTGVFFGGLPGLSGLNRALLGGVEASTPGSMFLPWQPRSF